MYMRAPAAGSETAIEFESTLRMAPLVTFAGAAWRWLTAAGPVLQRLLDADVILHPITSELL